MKKIAFALTIIVGGCATQAAPAPPVVVENGCKVFRDYPGKVSDITPSEARVWAAGNRAKGEVYCGQKWVVGK